MVVARGGIVACRSGYPWNTCLSGRRKKEKEEKEERDEMKEGSDDEAQWFEQDWGLWRLRTNNKPKTIPNNAQ